MTLSEAEGAMITIRGNGNISSCNQAACDMFGRVPRNLLVSANRVSANSLRSVWCALP